LLLTPRCGEALSFCLLMLIYSEIIKVINVVEILFVFFHTAHTTALNAATYFEFHLMISGFVLLKVFRILSQALTMQLYRTHHILAKLVAAGTVDCSNSVNRDIPAELVNK